MKLIPTLAATAALASSLGCGEVAPPASQIEPTQTQALTVIDPPQIGVFSEGVWYLDASGDRKWSSGDMEVDFGTGGDLPFVLGNARCNVNALADLGVMRGASWFLTLNDMSWDADDPAFQFTQTTIPLSLRGRIVSFHNGTWRLDSNSNRQWDIGDATFHFGQAGDEPVIGDWGGWMGVYRKGVFILDTNGDNAWTPDADEVITFHDRVSGGLPVAADFNPSIPGTEIGLFSGGVWMVDMNGNRRWDGERFDAAWNFGQRGDLPVVGAWVGCSTRQ